MYTNEHASAGPLFDLDAKCRARARTTDPRTSHDAAREIDTLSIEGRVVASLRLDGPATSHELAARLGLSLVTVSPRLRPLEELGLVRREGVRERRTVWGAVKR